MGEGAAQIDAEWKKKKKAKGLDLTIKTFMLTKPLPPSSTRHWCTPRSPHRNARNAPRLLPARAPPQLLGPAGRDGAAPASPGRERSPSTCRTRRPGSSSTVPRIPTPLPPRASRGLPRAPRVRALPSDKGRRRRPRRSGKRGPVPPPAPPPAPPRSPMLRPPAQARRSGSGSRRHAQAGHCNSIRGATGVEGAAPSRGRPGAEAPLARPVPPLPPPPQPSSGTGSSAPPTAGGAKSRESRAPPPPPRRCQAGVTSPPRLRPALRPSGQEPPPAPPRHTLIGPRVRPLFRPSALPHQIPSHEPLTAPSTLPSQPPLS